MILHLLIIWALTWVHVPSNTPSGFLWVVIAKAALFRGLLLPPHWMHYSYFTFDISEFLSSLYVYDACPYHWSFLESHLDCWNTYLSCIYHIQWNIPPWTTFPFASCSLSLGSEPFITICLSLDHSCSRPRSKAQYIIWALNLTKRFTAFYKEFYGKHKIFYKFDHILNANKYLKIRKYFTSKQTE